MSTHTRMMISLIYDVHDLIKLQSFISTGHKHSITLCPSYARMDRARQRHSREYGRWAPLLFHSKTSLNLLIRLLLLSSSYQDVRLLSSWQARVSIHKRSKIKGQPIFRRRPSTALSQRTVAPLPDWEKPFDRRTREIVWPIYWGEISRGTIRFWNALRFY